MAWIVHGVRARKALSSLTNAYPLPSTTLSRILESNRRLVTSQRGPLRDAKILWKRLDVIETIKLGVVVIVCGTLIMLLCPACDSTTWLRKQRWIAALTCVLVRCSRLKEEKPFILLFFSMLWVLIFVVCDVATIESCTPTAWALSSGLLALFLVLIYNAFRLYQVWRDFTPLTNAILCLPLGIVFDNLPKRLTSRFAALGDALSLDLDEELEPRLAQLRPSADVVGPTLAQFFATQQISEWAGRRDARLAYGDDAVRDQQRGPSVLRDEYIALEVVRYVNRHIDLIWNRVATLAILCLLLMTAANSYPFQPAGSVFGWMATVVLFAVLLILHVVIGLQGNELVCRVNRRTGTSAFFSLDLAAKLAAFVAPVLGLLAVLSIGVSDVLRLIFGPLVN